MSIARHGDVDDVLLDRLHLLEPKPPFGEYPRAKILNHDVRHRNEFADDFHAFRATNIQAKTQLVCVGIAEVTVCIEIGLKNRKY